MSDPNSKDIDKTVDEQDYLNQRTSHMLKHIFATRPAMYCIYPKYWAGWGWGGGGEEGE